MSNRAVPWVGKWKTCRRYNIPGHAHLLTFSCFKHRPFLSRDRSRIWFLESLTEAREKHAFDLWACVVMPEHVHLLIHPRRDDYSISDILTDLKHPVTHKALKYIREYAPSFLEKMRDEQRNGKVSHRFWQRGGGYDRNLFDAKAIHATIQYIHANPVRRGIVNSPEQWPWSTSRYYLGQRECFLVPDTESLPSLPREVR